MYLVFMETLKRFFVYQLKRIEFRYRTWQNAVRISRAYRGAPQRRMLKVAPRLVRSLAGGAAGLLLLYAAVAYGPRLVSPPRMQGGAVRAPSATDTVVESWHVYMPQEVSARADTTDGDTGSVHRLMARSWSPAQVMDRVVVANKATEELFVIGRVANGTWEVRNRFQMATGKRKGRKENEGDLRTPEGYYYVIGRKDRSELSDMYGPLAYILNYPNERDLTEGRTGQGIWIHGSQGDRVPSWTHGCLVLSNEDVAVLEKHLSGGIGTPVFIVDSADTVLPQNLPDYMRMEAGRRRVLEWYRTKQVRFFTILDEWEKAWESRDIERYARFYGESGFDGQGASWNEWKAKKAATFERYSSIAVSLDRLFLSELAESTAVVRFLQTYESNVNRIEDGKRLTFRSVDGTWKMIRESVSPREELL